jgi:hypothetical protein
LVKNYSGSYLTVHTLFGDREIYFIENGQSTHISVNLSDNKTHVDHLVWLEFEASAEGFEGKHIPLNLIDRGDYNLSEHDDFDL